MLFEAGPVLRHSRSRRCLPSRLKRNSVFSRLEMKEPPHCHGRRTVPDCVLQMACFSEHLRCSGSDKSKKKECNGYARWGSLPRQVVNPLVCVFCAVLNPFEMETLPSPDFLEVFSFFLLKASLLFHDNQAIHKTLPLAERRHII